MSGSRARRPSSRRGPRHRRAVALALAREGAIVAIVDIDPDATVRTAREANEVIGHERAYPHVCDVADRAAVAATMDRFVARAGGLDIVVNNAVHFHYARFARCRRTSSTAWSMSG